MSISPRYRSLLFGLLSFAVWSPAFAGPADPPAVRVENVRRVFHNGEHNAFTDLIEWQGKLWLTFRSCPDGHMVFPTSRVMVLSSSDDGKTWQPEHEFSVARRDVRDPHFLEFKGKLFIYTGTWWSGDGELPREDYDINKHLGYGVFTADGNSWSEPRPLEGTYGHYIWRAVASPDGETAYLCARRKQNYSELETGAGGTRIMEGALLESVDGLNWRFRSLFQEEQGNETDFIFEPDGSLLALSRSGGGKSDLARSRPPFEKWQRSTVPAYIGGPLLTRWAGRYLVGGRRNSDQGPVTTLYWLDEKKSELSEFATLPSGGDNSYPGLHAFDDRHALVSWYSSHEKDADGKVITAIYLADLVVKDD